MVESSALARFEDRRSQLLRVTYKLLGRLGEAEAVVDHTFQQLHSKAALDLADLDDWCIATAASACLALLRARKARREKPLGARLPDPWVTLHGVSPALADRHEVDDISLALLFVLETLSPAERLVYVLRDMFAVPFEQLAVIVERTPVATRQLQSRAQRRVSGASRLLQQPARTPRAPQQTVEAFLVAARAGDFDALLTVLDPNVVLRADRGTAAMGGAPEQRGAGLVAKQTLGISRLTERAQLVVVNGGPGVLSWLPGGQPFVVLGFTVLHHKIVELYVFADPARLARLDLPRRCGA